MEITCDIIKDVLPLYAEDLVSADTKAMVEAHLPTCADCKDMLVQLRRAEKIPLDVEFSSLDSVKRDIRNRRVLTGLLVFFVTVSVLICVFFQLTRPHYLTLEKAGVRVIEDGDKLYFDFGENVDCFAVGSTQYEGEEQATITITAYSRRLNIHYGNMLVVSRNSADGTEPVCVSSDVLRINYDNSPLGEEDLLLWGEPMREHVISLPRLVLGYYFLMALGAGVVFLVPALLLRRKKAGKILGAIGALFLCYGTASMLVIGLDWYVYEAVDLTVYLAIIVILALCLWSSILTAWRLRGRKD